MEKYFKSSFFKKYQNTYYSDSILKCCFAQSSKVHRLKNITSMSYEEVYENNIRVIQDFLDLYWNEISLKNEEQEKLAYQMIHSFHIDPDCKAIKRIGDIECTADALISLNRLYRHEHISSELVQGYRLYRKTPIFFFPKETNGINTTRARVFGDRIDFTLFDIKRYLEAGSETVKSSCRLISAFRRPITERWLGEMASFPKIVDWLGIKGIFTNDDYEVFDIEKSNDSIITGYFDSYPRKWTNAYYNSLKKKIELFMNSGGEYPTTVR